MHAPNTNLTLKQRRKLAGVQAVAAKPERSSSTKQVSRTIALLILLLAFGGGTALGMIYFKRNPRLQEMYDMEALLADAGSDMPADVRQLLFGQIQEIGGSMGRGGLRGRGEDDFENPQRLSRFFAMSSADQLAALEARIAREKRFEAMRAQRQAEAAANASSQSADASKNSSDGNNGNGNGNGNGGNGRGGRGSMNDDQRVARKEKGLAQSQPTQRAQSGLMRQMNNAVRVQQGLASRQ